MTDQPGLEEARRKIKTMLADLEIKVGSTEWFAAADALNAAHPIIAAAVEREVRERVAKDMRSRIFWPYDDFDLGILAGAEMIDNEI